MMTYETSVLEAEQATVQPKKNMDDRVYSMFSYFTCRRC